jgi:hypothetical protein
LAEGGFVDMLNNTEFISEEDYHSPELIAGCISSIHREERRCVCLIQEGQESEAKEIIQQLLRFLRLTGL